MLLFVLMSLFAGGAVAQTCDCRVLSQEDKDGNREQVLIAVLGTDNITAADCDAESFELTECYEFCFNASHEFVTGNEKCEPHFQEEKAECLGDTWCLRIANANPGQDPENSVLSAYARIHACPGGEFDEFVELPQNETQQTLCCDSDGQLPCDVDDCECGQYSLCDCGVFIDGLLNHPPWTPPGNNDYIPLARFSTDFDGEYNDINGTLDTDKWQPDCSQFPTNTSNPTDVCTQYCKALDMTSYLLGGPHPNNPAVTLGNVMCLTLYNRLGNKYEAIVDEPLFSHARVNHCDGQIGWSVEATIDEGDELLCCNDIAIWYPCV